MIPCSCKARNKPDGAQHQLQHAPPKSIRHNQCVACSGTTGCHDRCASTTINNTTQACMYASTMYASTMYASIVPLLSSCLSRCCFCVVACKGSSVQCKLMFTVSHLQPTQTNPHFDPIMPRSSFVPHLVLQLCQVLLQLLAALPGWRAGQHQASTLTYNRRRLLYYAAAAVLITGVLPAGNTVRQQLYE